MSDQKLIELINNDFTLGFPRISKNYLSITGFLAESICCSFMVWVFLKYGLPKIRDNLWVEKYAIYRGLVLGISCFFIVGITGCAMNPFYVICGSMVTGTFPRS